MADPQSPHPLGVDAQRAVPTSEAEELELILRSALRSDVSSTTPLQDPNRLSRQGCTVLNYLVSERRCQSFSSLALHVRTPRYMLQNISYSPRIPDSPPSFFFFKATSSRWQEMAPFVARGGNVHIEAKNYDPTANGRSRLDGCPLHFAAKARMCNVKFQRL